MKVILIRHGEPRYDEVEKRGYPFQGYDLGKLTNLGVTQAKKVSKDKRLKGATLIISSPYTRALQTAAIISKNTQIDLTVENDLHEWLPSVDFKDHYTQKAFSEYMEHQGKDITNKVSNWETVTALRTRVLNSLLPYKKDHDKVIVVCHGMVIAALTDFNHLVNHCEIKEITL